jgi:hypothetical protein
MDFMAKECAMLPLMNFFLRGRAEGRIQEMSMLDKIAYLVKYCAQPEMKADASVMARFERQKSLLPHFLAPPSPGDARLGFVGDLMWIRRNWDACVPAPVLRRLCGLDGLVGNLETVISENIPVNEFWPDLFRFNSDPRLVSSFQREDGSSLFGALSFANNHTLDHGDGGALDTLHFLKSQAIPVSGITPKDGRKWTAFSRKGISFGFYAATFGLNDPSLLTGSALHLNLTNDFAEAEQALQEMESLDVKIVSLHWGHEFEPYPTPRQTALAEALVKAGADIVAGSHPHIPQPPEIFLVNGYGSSLKLDGVALKGHGKPRKAIIFYSLGNFLSAMFTAPCRLGTLWKLSFRREPEGVDWALEPPEFFYSASHKGGRKLVPLADAPLSSRARARIRRIQDRICLEHFHPLG